MRRTRNAIAWFLLGGLALGGLAIGTAAIALPRGTDAASQQTPTGPRVQRVRIEGKHLIVEGENFNVGAVALVNGEEQPTKNDANDPSTVLILKKAAKRLAKGAAFSLQIQNPGGQQSDRFGFFNGRTITLGDGGKLVELAVGERFALLLKKDNYDWTAAVLDETIVKPLKDVPPVTGSQGVYQAERLGRTTLTAAGELPCHKSNPPCMAPTLHFEVTLLVHP